MIAALATPSSLHDGELTLLPLDSGIPALLVAASYDDEITRWTQVPQGMTLLDAGLVVAGWAGNERVVRLQVCLPELSPAGLVTVWINARDKAEVGYWLLAAARGHGVARRALAMLCDWTFASSDIDELELTTLPGNTASEKVAAACGFDDAGFIELDVKGERRTLRLWLRARDEEKRSAAGQRASVGT
ncbi:MAG: GNAT family N-acetyltransferase [Candidatus Dormibacteraeota bacterium]|uniref:GNAT family N-acetyltransferase n=1 Tax=Candidatus Aeolococcus gillhamiae TaxID=3127015 RepID=A0A934N6Y4_9BACT|nr:GNAT family N-acetyltransferase [Candidatus Dormibacteraeota bacterium]